MVDEFSTNLPIVNKSTPVTDYFSRDITVTYQEKVNLLLPNDPDYYSGLKFIIRIARYT